MQTRTRDDGFAAANPSFEGLEFEDNHGQCHLDVLPISIINRHLLSFWLAAFQSLRNPKPQSLPIPRPQLSLYFNPSSLLTNNADSYLVRWICNC
jgi:hypothetical protein